MSMCTSDRDQAIQDRVNAASRTDDEWINDAGEIIDHPKLRRVGWTLFWIAIGVAVVAFYVYAEGGWPW